RKYSENYLKFAYTYKETDGEELAVCVVCSSAKTPALCSPAVWDGTHHQNERKAFIARDRQQYGQKRPISMLKSVYQFSWAVGGVSINIVCLCVFVCVWCVCVCDCIVVLGG